MLHKVPLPPISTFRRLRQEDGQKESLSKQTIKNPPVQKAVLTVTVIRGPKQKGMVERGGPEVSQGRAEDDTRSLNLETKVGFQPISRILER